MTPTREQVLAAIESTYCDRHATTSPQSSLNVGDVGAIADAVLALLATPTPDTVPADTDLADLLERADRAAPYLAGDYRLFGDLITELAHTIRTIHEAKQIDLLGNLEQAVNDTRNPHPYAGNRDHCDTCSGPPDAPRHHHTDPSTTPTTPNRTE